MASLSIALKTEIQITDITLDKRSYFAYKIPKQIIDNYWSNRVTYFNEACLKHGLQITAALTQSLPTSDINNMINSYEESIAKFPNDNLYIYDTELNEIWASYKPGDTRKIYIQIK